MSDGPLARALLGLSQRAREATDWTYRTISPVADSLNGAVNYYAGPHLSQAMGHVTQLAGLLSPAGGGKDALAGSAETSRGLLGGDLLQTLHGGGEMGLGLLGMVPGLGMATKWPKVRKATGALPPPGSGLDAGDLIEKVKTRLLERGFTPTLPENPNSLSKYLYFHSAGYVPPHMGGDRLEFPVKLRLSDHTGYGDADFDLRPTAGSLYHYDVDEIVRKLIDAFQQKNK